MGANVELLSHLPTKVVLVSVGGELLELVPVH